MVGTTIHNLLIEISGFAGILESIEFAFTSAESFRAWQDYLCFHDLAVDAGMCLLFFRRPSFVCETWRDVFSWCTKQKNKMYIVRWNCTNQKWIIELPFPEPLHMKSGMIRLTPTKSSLVSPLLHPRINEIIRDIRTFYLCLTCDRWWFSNTLGRFGLAIARPSPCTLARQGIFKARGLRVESLVSVFHLLLPLWCLRLQFGMWRWQCLFVLFVLLVLFFFVLCSWCCPSSCYCRARSFYSSRYSCHCFVSRCLLPSLCSSCCSSLCLLVFVASCVSCLSFFLLSWLLRLCLFLLLCFFSSSFLFLFLLSFSFSFFIFLLLFFFLFFCCFFVFFSFFLFFVFEAWCHLPGAVWVRRTPQQGGSSLGFSHDTSAIVLVSIPECLWKKAAPQYIKHHRKIIEAAKRVSASALISGAFGMCSHAFWIFLTFQKLGGQR